MRVTGLDHIVLIVRDAEASAAWYHEHLGLEPLRMDEWRRGEVFFPSVRIDATTIIDLLPGEPSGRTHDHLCLVVDDDPVEIASAGRLRVVDGPDTRWGAQGYAVSVYVTDPDGHVIELRRYDATATS